MKLVELLAKEMSAWPEGGSCDYCCQSDSNTEVFFGHPVGSIFLSERADETKGVTVTRAQWQAERDRQNGGEWKRHRGGKCPVHGDQKVEVKLRDGDIQQAYARCFAWPYDSCDTYANIMQYRIISQPQAEEPMKAKFDGVKLEFSRDGVNFSEIGATSTDYIAEIGIEPKWQQSSGPLAWRDTIIHCQAIIEDCEREIQRNVDLLDAEGLMMQKDSKKAMQHYAPDIDLTYWGNWKAGDVVECTESSCDSAYTVGNYYKVAEVTKEYARVADDCGPESYCHINDSEYVAFILSR